MVRIGADADTRFQLARTRGASFVAEYRGFTTVKPSWSTVSYKIPENIVILTHPTSANADEWGVRMFGSLRAREDRGKALAAAYCAHRAHCSFDMQHVKKITAQAIPLCDGQRGWLNAFTRGDDTYEQVFARAHDRVYLVQLKYQTQSGDGLHAAQAIRTLCPEGIGEAKPPSDALPMLSPQSWHRGVGYMGMVADPFKGVAYWFNLGGVNQRPQWLVLSTVSDVSEYITPEEEAQEMLERVKSLTKDVRVHSSRAMTLCNGVSAWMNDISGTDPSSFRLRVVSLYAYLNDTSYIVQYTRSAAEPEDPAAHKAMLSLCPPQPAAAK